MNIGMVTNFGSAGATEDANNLIRAEFTVHARADAGLVVGEILYVGAAVEVDSSQLWVGQVPLTVVSDVTKGSVSMLCIISTPHIIYSLSA